MVRHGIFLWLRLGCPKNAVFVRIFERIRPLKNPAEEGVADWRV